jgi:hypothetical protein
MSAILHQMPPLRGDTDAALDFIRRFRPSGTICLVAIVPDGGTETRTFNVTDTAALRQWIEGRQGRKNLYFTVNTVKGYVDKKPSKADMSEAVANWLDLDPLEIEEKRADGFAHERERLEQIITELLFSEAPPSFVIDSGGGFQLFWLLDKPHSLDGKDGQLTKKIEAVGRRLRLRFGGDAVENVDRIMRLPGSINLPNKKKLEKGRQPALAKLVWLNDDRYTLDKLRQLSCRELDGLEVMCLLDEKLLAKLVQALIEDDKLHERWLGGSTGLNDSSRSAFDLSVVALLKKHEFEEQDAKAVLSSFPHGAVSEKLYEGDERYWDRLWGRSHDPSKKGDGSGKVPQRDRLLAIGLSAELWHDARREAYATIERDDHREHYSIDSQDFRNWLIGEYMQLNESNPRVPPATAVNEALAGLKARAMKGPIKEQFVRVAGYKGKVYLDLGDVTWRAVEVDGDGWRVVERPPVPMLRYAGMEPLPTPVRGSSIEELRSYVNAPDEDAFRLIVGFCVASLFPGGPFTLLEFAGPQGSLKTAATRAIKRMIDPNKVSLRSKPRTEDDLFISAEHNHVLAYENVSSINEELADWLCRLATGAGIAKRSLYTNKDETLLDACKPVIVNGIPDLINRYDLADRAIMIVLQPYKGKRRPDEEVMREFDTVARPRILGCVLQGVARAIARSAEIELPDDGPRMADFAKRVIAAFPAFGWPEEDFIRLWRTYRSNVAVRAVDMDAVARAILVFMEERDEWIGSADELLCKLGLQSGKDWPTTAGHLANRLRRAMPMLGTMGFDVELEGKDPKTRRRIITLMKKAAAGTPEKSTGSQPSLAEMCYR